MKRMDMMVNSSMMMNSNMMIDTGMLEEYDNYGMMSETMGEEAGLSSMTILIIVVVACALVGGVLGFFVGKRNANR